MEIDSPGGRLMTLIMFECCFKRAWQAHRRHGDTLTRQQFISAMALYGCFHEIAPLIEAESKPAVVVIVDSERCNDPTCPACNPRKETLQ